MNGIFSFARFSVVMLIVALVVLAGCSPRPTGSVSGKVSHNGKLLKGGKVVFVGADGGQSVSSSINEDGTYLVQELPAGSYKICVDTSFLKGPSGPAGASAPGGVGAPGGSKAPPSKGAGGKVVEGSPTPSDPAQNAKKYVAIPDKYKDAATTDLLYKFDGGFQTYDIDLK